MKTVLRIGFSALAIAALALGRDKVKAEAAKTNAVKEEAVKEEAVKEAAGLPGKEPAGAILNQAVKPQNQERRDMRVARLGAESDEGTLVARQFKTIVLPRIKSGRCATSDTGVAIQSGDSVALFVDDSREAVLWTLQESTDRTVTVRVCNQEKQDVASEPWAVMLFVRR